MKKRWWIIGAVVLVVGGIGSYSMMGGSQPTGAVVTMATVEKNSMQNKVMTTGQVKVKNSVTLYAGTDGFLRDFSLQAGDSVKQGQIIGKLDQSDMDGRLLDIDAQIELKRADLAKTKLGEEPEAIAQLQERVAAEQRNVDTAAREHERALALFHSGASTQQEVDKTAEAVSTAESNLKIAKQNLALKQKGPRPEELQSIEAQIKKLQIEKSQIEKDRVQSVIRAPLDGTILTTKIENGQYVGKGKELFTLGDLSKLAVEAQVSESDAPKIQLNQAASIEDNSLGKKQLKAKVTRIAPIAEATTDSSQGKKIRVAVTLDLLETAPQLKPGYQVDVNVIVLQSQNALQVPIESIQQDANGTAFVWVGENGVAKKRPVETGMENELFCEIRSGLTPGEKIITTPPDTLKDNDPILEQPQGMM
ncbi:efflux RND transporter periplasmic adaptor subunit [Brevibacillus fluminis]|uniref:Efflux RND transporter periplasmic adaptor subunit n=1 Tax=Brevibacillus fluminis TaxID=511487 RepID=A0A3M8DXY0_9BACL|nr:efflux RND transporter periplasmic adaptor subunit [Brevibacillus fluminis]RNB92379.1 efflux RND transporter periplasmic adaptor subunit [Brevibacillus fluminis]